MQPVCNLRLAEGAARAVLQAPLALAYLTENMGPNVSVHVMGGLAGTDKDRESVIV